MTWNCSSCTRYLNSFPFALMDVMDSDNVCVPVSERSNTNTSVQFNDPLSEFRTRFFKNLKLGHLNINSLGGCKFSEVLKLLSANLLDDW